jgi:hypothetical protein
MSIADQDEKKMSTGSYFGIMVVSFLAIIWGISGVLAFFKALSCAASDTAQGNTLQKILGLMIAILFGPFYWIFYFMSTSYCR